MIKPYFEAENGRLYCGDCLEILPELEIVDLILTDPPYGIEDKISKGGGSHTKSSVKFHQRYSETNQTLDQPISDRHFDIINISSKNQIIFGGNYYALQPCRGFIVWDKPEMRIPTMSDCEYAWTSFDRPAKIFRVSRGPEIRAHPTQKPVGLFVQILKKYAKQNQTILDCFAGSGTTALACERLPEMGLKWTLIEKEERYCEIAAKRIQHETQQLKLF